MAYESNSIFWVEVDKVVPNPYQPRREFNEHNLQDLAESIRMYGILQPLTVTRKEVQLSDGAFRSEYELVAGERRLRAARLAGLTQVPVIIRSGEETELMKLELAIIENLQREDLNPVDRAMAFKQLSSAFGLSHSQIAKKVGRSREFVSNTIRLLLLPDTIMSALSQGDISDGHARTLLMLNDRPEEQDVVFREILLKKLSVREVERISRKIAQDKVRKKSWDGTDPELIEIEKQFMDSLGTRVQISKTDFGGKLTIDYYSSDDLQKLLELIHTAQKETGGEAHIEAVVEATPLEAVDESAPADHREDDMPASPQPSTEPSSFDRSYELGDDTNEVSDMVTDEHTQDTSVEERIGDQGPRIHMHEARTMLSDTPTQERLGMRMHMSERRTMLSDEAEAEPEVPAKEPEQVSSPVEPAPQKSEEEDLYSIKNFSL